ncbi:phosphoglycerate kinase [Candidatus Woesearchaeota archaeon]|nr:phosphoglycerate kinase [Nanoarchaeota archaeon]MCB9370537.1 phosphoglycerate kinase [Candidatus Woesearchaeota archaeon]USN43612.1 MAG: phosphoglycerate kinase [Candidatus Woesearchaeota archaeon]
MFNFQRLEDTDVKGKVVGVRVDINSPIIDGKVKLNDRIKAHSKTLRYLHEHDAKVVVLAHQGRKGDEDCVSLQAHGKMLSEILGFEVLFENETYSEKVVETISHLENGEVLLLENVRFLDDEKKPELPANKILMLEKLFDIYVFDAFSNAHRADTSVVGFKNIPNVAGLVMEKELDGLNKITSAPKPAIHVFGGAKADDLVEFIEQSLQKKTVDKVLLTGVIGDISLIAKGYPLGKKTQYLEEKELLEGPLSTLKRLLSLYPNKIFCPLDLAYAKDGERREISVEELGARGEELRENLVMDIGRKTVEAYTKLLSNAGSIYLKGPAGDFEEEAFQDGTKGIIKAIVNSKAFSYMGGGHSLTALNMFDDVTDFSYVSLAGGALVYFLSGKELPGIKALEESFQKFH